MLEQANAKYKAATDKHKREKVSVEGDILMVFLHKEKLPAGSYNKLRSMKYGPHKIMKKINNNANVVDLSGDIAMSKTFFVADLFQYHPE